MLNPICHDFGQEDGCTMVANPENTVLASDHGYPDSEDLYFCDHCKAVRELLIKEALDAVDLDKLLTEDAEELLKENRE